MESPATNRLFRNVVFVAIIVALTAALIGIRFGSGVDDGSSVAPSDGETTLPDTASKPRAEPPPAPTPDEPKPKPIDITFAEYAEQLQALRGNSLAITELKARIEDRHIQWEGDVRYTLRNDTGYRVSIRVDRTSLRTSAQVSFDLAFEDELSALLAYDHVRFEGIVTSAPNSISVFVDGLAIEVIE